MALVGDALYVANTDALVRVPVHDGRHADRGAPARRSSTCPAGRSTITGPRTSSPAADGTKLYVDRRLEQQRRRERHRRRKTDARRSGRSMLRPARIASSRRACAIRTAWRGSRRRGALWTVGQRARRARQRSRARLHDVGAATAASTAGRTATTAQHVDARVKPQRPDLVAKAIVPDYALGPHTASLGLAFVRGERAAGAVPRAACSSASTARGTASRAAATR